MMEPEAVDVVLPTPATPEQTAWLLATRVRLRSISFVRNEDFDDVEEPELATAGWRRRQTCWRPQSKRSRLHRHPAAQY